MIETNQPITRMEEKIEKKEEKKLREMSSEVRDDNPYSRLLALKVYNSYYLFLENGNC